MAPMKESDMQHVIRQCSYCPLAINLIAKWLEAEYGSHAVPERVLKQLDATGKEKQIKQCIKQSFKTLQERFQTILCQLTWFQSAPFHVDGAVTVLYDDDTLSGNLTKCKLDMLLLKSKHLVEIENCSQSRTETDPSYFVMKNRQSVVKYSLHPFVYTFLKDESGKSKHKKLMVESKRRFYKHCKKIIYKSGKESNRNSLTCLKILEDNRPHIIAFFDSLQNGETGVGCEGLDNRSMSMVHIAATAPGYMTSYDLINIFERQADVADTENAHADFVFFKSCAGISYLRLEWINKAEILRKQISNKQTALLSESDVKLKNTAELMFTLFCARLQMKQGSQNEALKTLKKAQDIVRNLDKRRHLLSLQLDTMNAIGCCYYKMQEFGRAVDQYDRALEMASKHVEGNRHFRIPHILVNKASALHEWAMWLMKEDKEKGLIGLRESQECCERSLKVEQELNQDGTGNSGEKLALMSEIYKNLGELEKSLHYAREALSIHRKAFYPPHQDITISTYRVARTLHLMSKEAESEGNKEKSFYCNSEARKYYDETLRYITWGGLDRDYADYPFLKKEHMDVLTYVGMQGKLRKTEKKYKKFEDGDYEKKKKKSMKNMLRRHEKASKLKKKMVSEISSSSSSTTSSSDDENDDYYWNMNPQLMRQDSGCVESITSSLASFRESLSEDVEEADDAHARRRLQRQQSALKSVDEDVFDDAGQPPEPRDNAD